MTITVSTERMEPLQAYQQGIKQSACMVYHHEKNDRLNDQITPSRSDYIIDYKGLYYYGI